jgi:hypothetical protein
MLRAVLPTSVRLSLRRALSFYADAVSGVKIAKEPLSVLRYIRLLRLNGDLGTSGAGRPGHGTTVRS